MPRSGIARSYDSSVLDFEKTPYCKRLHLRGFERLYLLRFDVFKRTSCPRSIMVLHHATLKLYMGCHITILPILYSFKIASGP